LKITDLVEALGINRSYISAFINAEYQMNFSSYINSCRLDEYNHLKENPAYKERNQKELAEMAGFSSYKSLQRFRGKDV
jgi:AraC-like DNA-binding protein